MCNNLGKEGMYIMIYCIMITLLPRVIITEACFYLNYYENILSGNFQIMIDSYDSACNIFLMNWL